MLKQLGKSQRENKGLNILKGDLTNKVVSNYTMFFTFASLILICVYPEISFANTTMESQLDKVGYIANNKLKVVGLSTVTIGISIVAIIRGSLMWIGVAVLIGVSLALYLEWIAAGMVLAG